MRHNITEAQAERMADAAVQRRLLTDGAYRHAEDAEQQAAREQEITAEVWEELTTRYAIVVMPTGDGWGDPIRGTGIND